MTNYERTLRRILYRIGAERVQAGVAAFDDPEADGIGGCFAARCMGEKYEFVRGWLLQSDYEGWVPLLSNKLGITDGQVIWLTGAFDHKPRKLRRHIHRWLEESALSQKSNDLPQLLAQSPLS